MIPQY